MNRADARDRGAPTITVEFAVKCVTACITLALVVTGCAKHSPDSEESRDDHRVKLVPLASRRMQAGHIDVPHDRIPNLIKRSAPSEQFLVPEGTTNVALNKPVASSCANPIIGRLEMITDGVMTCRPDGSAYSDVELEPGVQHITIDLGKPHSIYAIRFWHCYPMNPVYFDVVVQIAGDPGFTVNASTLFNNDHDNSAGLGAGTDKNYVEYLEGKVVDGRGMKARYVRLYGNGNWANDLNHYTEVEVFGKPLD